MIHIARKIYSENQKNRASYDWEFVYNIPQKASIHIVCIVSGIFFLKKISDAKQADIHTESLNSLIFNQINVLANITPNIR